MFPSLFPVLDLRIRQPMSDFQFPVKNLFLFLLAMPVLISCNSAVGRIFDSEKTPHETYADKIDNSPAGKEWVNVSKNILLSPQAIKLPYSQLGHFPADKPRALALSFTAKRGEHINFDLQKSKNTPYAIYADVFKQDGTVQTHLITAGPDDAVFGFDAAETGVYLLRLQPQLASDAEYHLSVTVGPSLGFPVAGTKARVGSVWGDSREGGKRSHEGIDIFAPKLTPAIAAADGYITRVADGGLGGKTVSLRTGDLSLYYAHLDKQLVYEGQRVKKGDTLGLVGNTGNAQHTRPHLHFGIYTYGGAIDPLPFVEKNEKAAPALIAKKITGPLQLTRPLKTKDNTTVDNNTVLTPLAVTADGYIVELPDGTIMHTPFKSVKALKA